MPTPPTILLHTCCGPCATTCTERLGDSGEEPLLFFSNCNIFPREEYDLRLEHARKLAVILGLDLIEDAYDHGAWLSAVAGLEDEPERGRRCERCFRFSLSRTADRADLLGLPAFTTTLTVSRYKSSAQIFEVGKGNGYERSIDLSRLYGLYRQNFCGCEFSLGGRKGSAG